MKALKNSFVVLLVLALMTIMLPVSFAENIETNGTCGDTVYYSFDEEGGTLTISGEGAVTDSTCYKAFSMQTKEVIIEDGVTALGNNAFENFYYLVSAVIPDSLESIGDNAFANCVSLKKLYLPESVSSTGAYCFNNCFSLKDFSLMNTTCEIVSAMPCLAPYISDDENEIKAFINDYITAMQLLNSGKELTEDEAGLISYVSAIFEYSDIKPVKDAVITGYAYSTADIYANGHDIKFNCLCPTSHGNITFIPYTASTCVSNGNLAYYTCNDCQRHFTDSSFTVNIDIYDTVLPTTGHTPLTLESDAVAPTCTEKGCTAPVICSVCGEILKTSETVPATGHTDKNSDGICDTCGEEVTITKEPSSIEQILNFLRDLFIKIGEFFRKLFGN